MSDFTLRLLLKNKKNWFCAYVEREPEGENKKCAHIYLCKNHIHDVGIILISAEV